MSTAAQPATIDPKSAPDPKPTSAAPQTSGYSIARSLGKCAVCSRTLSVGEKYFAAVRESSLGLERIDVSAECWNDFDKSNLLAFWQTTLPPANAVKPKVFVDDTVLCELFERLAGEAAETSEPAKLNFRFVLGLILMRKRLLIYESTRVENTHIENTREFWTIRLKGRTDTMDLLNPRLTEDQIAEVSTQLTQILSGDPA